MKSASAFRWILLFIALIVGIALAQERQPERRGPASAKAYKQGTPENPIVVKRLDAEETPARRAQMSTEREERAANERTLAHWTIVLAIATVFLVLIAGGQLWMFRQQLKYMRQDLRHAKDELKLTRQEFLASHQPKIEVRRLQLRKTVDQRGVNFVIANVGAAEAKSVRADFNFVSLPPGSRHQVEKESMPPYSGSFQDLVIEGKALQPRQRSFIFVQVPDPPISDEVLGRVIQGTELLFFFGVIDYVGPDGVHRDTGFFRIYNSQENKFVIAEDPDYEWS